MPRLTFKNAFVAALSFWAADRDVEGHQLARSNVQSHTGQSHAWSPQAAARLSDASPRPLGAASRQHKCALLLHYQRAHYQRAGTREPVLQAIWQPV